jgi:hypothetical protein
MHRRAIHPEPDQGAARARPERRAGAADRPRRPDGARPPRPVQRLGGTLKDHPEATPQVLDAFCRNLYAPGFVYCVDRAFVATVRTPCLVLAGNDEAHPYPISEELSKLLPNCEFIAEWKTGAALGLAKARVKDFLSKHTPARA